MEQNLVFLKYNTPSSKNSRINGRFFSKPVQKYLKSYGIKSFSSTKKIVTVYARTPMTFPVEELRELFKNREMPIVVGFHFVRNSRRRWDIINIMQIVLDLLTAFDIIEDDSANCIIPMPFKINNEYWSYNKEAPGVYISVLQD